MSIAILGAAACEGDDEPAAEAPATTPARADVVRIAPPLDVKAPPADATKTASGLRYKKLASSDRGPRAQRSDTAMVKYTGWRPSTGETFFTTQTRGQPIALDVAYAAPGMAEALQLMRAGEKMMLWVPASETMPEPLVYEIEVVEVVAPVARAGRVSRP